MNCKVLIEARIENLYDLHEVNHGHRTAAEVRAVETDSAILDISVTTLCMPPSLIGQLGLQQYRPLPTRTETGIMESNVYGMALLTVQGREARVDVMEGPEGSPVRIGSVALGILDLVVASKGRRLIGNPEHGGEQMLEIWGSSTKIW